MQQGRLDPSCLASASSELREREWAILAPVLPPPKPGGRPRTVDLRGIRAGSVHVLRSGWHWRGLPHDDGPWSTGSGYGGLACVASGWDLGAHPRGTRSCCCGGWRSSSGPAGAGSGDALASSRPSGSPAPRLPGLQPLPHRWMVERTLAWIGRTPPRLSTDDDSLPATSEAWVDLSMVRLLLTRLAHEQVQPPFHYRPVA